MRAGQLGVQDEAEARVVLALLVSNLDVPVTANDDNNNANRRFLLFFLRKNSKVLPKKKTKKKTAL